jgi:sugar (pentulose or hexulose) kinase
VSTRLLGIDFGTGGTKACIIDDQGAVLAYAFREYPILHPRPGWSEHDAENYWTATREMIQQVLAETRCAPEEIAGVAVSSALPSMVMVDRQGLPVAPALNLMDRRATEEVALIRELVGESLIEEVTANRIEDHPSLVNLFWYERNRPDVFEKVSKALTIDGFIVARLTGRYTLNRSAAVFYGVAFDIKSGTFRPDILEQLHIDPEILPQLCDCTDVVGDVTAQAAAATGLAKGTPVVGGQVDCNAGWIAGGAVNPGDMQLNLGTCGVLGVVHQNMDYLSDADGLRMVNIPYTTSPSDTFAAVAVTTTGGQALRYLRDTFGSVEVDTERLLGISSYDLLTLQARDVPPGSDGLLVMPYFMGERSPLWDSDARGVLFGLSLHHGRGHVFRAFMEGVAYALYYSYSVLQRTGLNTSYPLIFNEGGAKSEVWRKIVTDVFGIPTALLKGRTGAPLGDAILAGVGVKVFKDFTVAKGWAEYVEPMEPDERNHALYMEYFDLYKNLYSDVSGRFADLQALLRRH